MSIITAAPWTENLGTKDGSTRKLVVERTPYPSHLPLIFTYAKKGDTDLNLVSGDSALDAYGDDLFDVRSKYATHQTLLAQALNSVGNALMIKRIIPSDAPPAANLRISVEIVKTQIDPKQREVDGEYKLDSNGNTISAQNTVEGHIVKFVSEYITPDQSGVSQVGLGKKRTGTLVGAAGEESQRIPLMDFEVAYQGAYGNLLGLRIWAPTVNSNMPVNETLISNEKAYPYYFTFIEKSNENATATVVANDRGEQAIQLVLKPDTYDMETDSDYYVGTELLDRWTPDEKTSNVTAKAPFGKLHVYEDNIAAVQAELAASEKALMSTYPGMLHDLDLSINDDQYRFNLFGGTTAQGTPYLSYQIDKTSPTATESVLRFTENSNIMATGGGDGTMSPQAFADSVAQEVSAFGDKNSKYQNCITYPISIFYDTGFPMATKKALGKLIAIRKDVAVALVPSVYGEREPTPSEESSICIALRTIMQAYPESTHFGTPVMRGMIFAHTGKLLNSRWRKRAPLIIEAAVKFAKYMGASDGKWKSEYSPDEGRNNRVEMFSQISEAYKPASVRNRDWKAGMIWVDACDLKEFYWPALRTVYEDDTSVLTSAITVMGICEIQKIGERVATNYKGNSKLTRGQLKANIERDVIEECSDRFDGRFDITPNVRFDLADIARGYSWVLEIKVAAANMKTVETLYIVAERKDADTDTGATSNQ